jgi:hypothetical protein
MYLYHGTNLRSAQNIIKHGISISKCSESTDFGQGFYTTESIQFAIKCALRKAKRTDDDAALLKYEIDASKLRGVKYFSKPTLEWCQFVINNRCGYEYFRATGAGIHNLDGKYEVVRGLTADGNVVDFAQYCLENLCIVQKIDIAEIYSKTYPEQFTFHSERSFKMLGKPVLVGIEGGEMQ